MRHVERYDPLDLGNIKEGVVRALLEREAEPLPPIEAFVGIGIYTLYYLGSFPAYQPLAAANTREVTVPIYVGKADTGTQGVYRRLCEHARSISEAEGLDCGDFRCRFLVLHRVWITLAEDALVDYYRPLWNCLIKGFGIHTPGRGRGQQRRSMWDTLHPGRGFVAGLSLPAGDQTREDLGRQIREFLQRGQETNPGAG